MIALASVLLAVTSVGAQAAPCLYDVAPLPVTKGTVSRITSKGVLLRDGTTIILPQDLLAHVRVGQTLAVRGLHAVQGQVVQAYALDGTPAVCAAPRSVTDDGDYPGSPGYDHIQTDPAPLHD